MLVNSGVDVRTAQHRLGHSDPRLTLGIYAQVVPEADREAAETLGAILSRDERAMDAQGQRAVRPPDRP